VVRRVGSVRCCQAVASGDAMDPAGKLIGAGSGAGAKAILAVIERLSIAAGIANKSTLVKIIRVRRQDAVGRSENPCRADGQS
jgi:hypothetical protein